MKSANLIAMVLAVALAACASTGGAPKLEERHDILGVRLDMPRDTVRETLGRVGKLQREERKRQEVWSVTDDRFDGVIVGYDDNWNVRFVTGVVRPGAAPIAFGQVVDTTAAEHRGAGESHTYTWRRENPPHYLIAIGTGDAVQYISLKKVIEPEP